MTFDLSEIEPALADPAFDPTWVILILQLPRLGLGEVRSVPVATAMQYIQDIAVQLSLRDSADRWLRELNKAVAQGLTPVIKLVATDQHAYVEVHGVQITATAKA